MDRMTDMEAETLRRYNQWLRFDQETKNELLAVTDEQEIADRFYRDLEFGTGGLRGVMGAGTNRMNRYTVRRATLGLAGLTAGLFTTGEYLEYSDTVQAVADFYGPTDFLHMDDFPGVIKHNAADSPESMLIGGALAEHTDLAIAAL